MRIPFVLLTAMLLGLSFLLAGCLEGRGPEAKRFFVNGVYANNDFKGDVFIDFNYTQKGFYSDTAIDFVETRFSIEIAAADCGFTPIAGTEMNTGLLFTPQKTRGIDNKAHIMFYLGRTINPTRRIIVKGVVWGECVKKISDGATVRLVLAATENQNDYNDLVSPYAEEVLGTLRVLGVQEYNAEWDKLTKR